MLNSKRASIFLLSLLLAAAPRVSKILAAETVFSGPQPGEKTTTFKILSLAGANQGQERDPIAENRAAPTALVFVQAVERSLVPLLRALDEYGAARKEQLKTEVIFLFGDRLEGEQRIKAAVRSLQLQSPVGLSLDGAEGPGNYGLNKECMMTVLATKGNQVTANFALVQPGIADAPKIIDALARVCGDTNPPSIEQLTERQKARTGAGRDRAGQMQRLGASSKSETTPRSTPDAQVMKPEEKFPGAVPTDPRLNALLRQLLRPTNDVATVDKLIADMNTHIKGKPDLIQQAVDGWTRVLHFGDRYGTAHARKMGEELLNKLKTAAKRE